MDADEILEYSIMNRSYTKEELHLAIQVYKRPQSVTKTICELGYPGAWTLYGCVQ
ncbi:hypothetical protein [Corynebacterium macginleyi]|uniref:hypothetical protein n=1 Tax=Corynebacterium macginleyi TaxID=38290 RepID=UPI001F19A107|nr:hypothetical protein [Corynebacterium macginleyi]MBK4162864.1 transposase [Corynebacterium macginleyi]